MIEGLVFFAAVVLYLLGLALTVCWGRLTLGLHTVIPWLRNWAKATLCWLLLSLLPADDEDALERTARRHDCLSALSKGWRQGGRRVVGLLLQARQHLPDRLQIGRLRRRYISGPGDPTRQAERSPRRRQVQRRCRRYRGRPYRAGAHPQPTISSDPALAAAGAVLAAGVRVGRRLQVRAGLLRAYEGSQSGPRA